MDKQIFSERGFINKKGYHSNAAISATMEKNSFGDNGFYATYKLSDCNRTVEISIDLDNIEEYENTLYKLDKILSITEKFKAAVIKLKPEIKEIERKRKMREKERLAEKSKENSS